MFYIESMKDKKKTGEVYSRKETSKSFIFGFLKEDFDIPTDGY